MTFKALRSREEYGRIFRHSTAHHTRYFTLRVSQENTSQPRLAVVVSKKVSSKATARNLLRRRIREYVRRTESATYGRDIIVYAKQEISKITRKELYGQLQYAINATKRKNI